MTRLYNKKVFKERRRELRQNQTEAEKRIWHQLRNKQLKGMKFFRQYSVGPYIVDFYCPKQKLAIELDGCQHGEEEKQQYDKYRSDYLAANGIDVVRFWNNEIMENMSGVLERIAEKLTAHDRPFGDMD